MKRNNKKRRLSFNKVFGDIREKITKITYYKIKETKAKKVPDLHPELKKFIAEQNEKWNNQFELNNEIKEFIKDQDKKWDQQFEFNHQQNQKWEDQDKKWDQQIQTNQVLLTSIQEILLRLERIENLPTIKKELHDNPK